MSTNSRMLEQVDCDLRIGGHSVAAGGSFEVRDPRRRPRSSATPPRPAASRPIEFVERAITYLG